ncbi:MAG: hypothetical protein IJL74_01140 [Bacilli bacterium]|nr:hypothetical protein [Bacilli bacterium]
MPTYVTHTIMAREVYKKLNNPNVSLDYMLTHSLGGDLTNFSKVRYDSHHKNRKEFFENMCAYIKENNLTEDPQALGVLYGHICHYALDDTAHPLVRKVSKTCVPNKKNHGCLEYYYDMEIVKEKYNKSINKYNNREIFKGRVNRKIAKLLDNTYEKTYNCKHLSRYYRFNIFIYKKIKYFYFFFSNNILFKAIGLAKFLKENKDVDLLNKKHKITYKSINGKEESKSFDQLYKESINKALKDIKEVNKLLK